MPGRLLKAERISYWLGVGAQPSDQACSVLIKKYGASGTHVDAAASRARAAGPAQDRARGRRAGLHSGRSGPEPAPAATKAAAASEPEAAASESAETPEEPAGAAE